MRSQYPRARVLAIDTSKAAALPGVVRVITAADIPGENKVGHLKHDQYSLIPIGGLTHYLGDAIALVVAETPEILEKAKKLVKVTYEPLTAVHNPPEAWAEGAPLVFDEEETNIQAYKHIARGDADTAIKNSRYVISQHFETPWTEHAFLEPECAVSYMDKDGYVMVLSTDQSSHTTLHECKLLLGSDKVRVQNQLVGGGFGGKEDMSVQHHAALITYLTGKTVKVKLTRPEIPAHPSEAPPVLRWTSRWAVTKTASFRASRRRSIPDTGAFASLGGPVLERACTHAAGPYNYQNFEIDGTAITPTIRPRARSAASASRRRCFATETLLDRAGRQGRHHSVGDPLPQRHPARTGAAERPDRRQRDRPCRDAGGGQAVLRCRHEGGQARRHRLCDEKRGRRRRHPRLRAAASLIVEDDGKLHIYSGASCIGQGLGTVLVQMIMTNTPLHRDQIIYERSNTWIAPDSGDTSGSRQTLVTGEACRRACEKLCAALEGHELADLAGQEFYGEYLAKTDKLGADVPHPVSHVAYGYATQMCVINKKTGKIEQLVAAHDVGKAVNPRSCEGQIEGGVVMSMGYALREQYPIDENCKPIEKYGELGLFRAHEIPQIVPIVVDKPGLDVACGAIGIGEITSIPTAPAIADAYFRYDGERRTKLPLTNTPYERKGK